MKLAAGILVAGSALFQLGAFLPVSRFYMATVEERLAIIQDQPVQWLVHLAGMGFGALIAAVGLLVLVPHLPRGVPSTVGAVSVVLVAVGTALWIWHLILRITAPEAFAGGDNPWWQFGVYTVLMQVALLALAYAFYAAGWPRWQVLVLAGGTLLTVFALIAFRDVPPFLHYVWLLVVGVGLMVASREAAPEGVSIASP